MPIRLESINCGNCGASLEIPESAQFVTCNHCQSSLAVKRMSSITLTEKIEQTVERLDATERKLAELVYRNERSEEQRRWDRERQSLMMTDKQGNRHKPSAVLGFIVLIVTLVMGFVIAGAGMGPFALVVPVFGVIGLIVSINKAQAYEAAQRRHKRRLKEISHQHQNSRNDNSRSNYQQQLETALTPDEYLRQLGQSESTYS